MSADTELTGGTWRQVNGVRRWIKDLPVDPTTPSPLAQFRNLRRLIACSCGARLTEPCRTRQGNWTHHRYRLVARRCVCGNPLRPNHQFCTDECRHDARADTYRRREVRTPTRERRRKKEAA